MDCHSPEGLAAFWCGVFGFTVLDRGEDIIEIGSGVPDLEDLWARQMPVTLVFVRVPEGETVKNRLHLDVSLIDTSTKDEVERPIALGAGRVDVGQGPDRRWEVSDDETKVWSTTSGRRPRVSVPLRCPGTGPCPSVPRTGRAVVREAAGRECAVVLQGGDVPVRPCQYLTSEHPSSTCRPRARTGASLLATLRPVEHKLNGTNPPTPCQQVGRGRPFRGCPAGVPVSSRGPRRSAGSRCWCTRLAPRPRPSVCWWCLSSP
ncbi:VOC family protein [Salinispora sp. H7-4]|uniref:VOC family protein n=1 Tax=Salinispora sp. H7-4 TaxID=2748321 RepID=UPI002814E0C5|nr:VOC family protein [Salinispora sp. H7-4]